MSKQPYTEVVEPETGEAREAYSPAEEAVVVEEQAQRHRWYFGDGMGKRILGVVMAVLVLGLLWYAYQHHLAQSGDVAVQGEDPVPRVIPENTANNNAPPPRKAIVTPQQDTTTMASATTSATIPASDSISPNPPNGMAFAGSGKFQVYRQGNLTWRVDTESGHTCIVFATMEEWRKPIVYEHGCANN